MSNLQKAVFFDVDGVLIDSLPQHLRICRDKAQEYGLDLHIPDVEQFRAQVRRGVKISPMFNFFKAVGFPDVFAQRAVIDYEQNFMTRYRPKIFSGIDKMLGALAAHRLKLGLVTSNIHANVVPVLGKAMRHFDESCLFFKPQSKAHALTEGVKILGLEQSDCIYVGDLPSDIAAAKDAHVGFLGVTYGWGITDEDVRLTKANSVAEIPSRLFQIIDGRIDLKISDAIA